MSVVCSWYNTDKTIIYCKLSRVWTWHDAGLALNDIQQMIDTEATSEKVHLIVDNTASTTIPIGTLQYVPQLFLNRPKRQGKTLVIVNPKSAILSIWNAYSKLLPRTIQERLRFFKSHEEVDAYLAQMPNTAES